MQPLRITGLVLGLGISLAGLYVLADGVTGFLTAQASFFAVPQIPIGMVIIALGVIGALVVEQLVARQSIDAQAQQIVSAPVSDFATKQATPTGQESAKSVLDPVKQVDFEVPRSEIAATSSMTIDYSSEKTQKPAPKASKPKPKKAAKSAKKRK